MTWSILLDVILVILLLYSAYVGYKNGFLKTVVKFIGYLCAILVSFIGSRLLASFVCELCRNALLKFSVQQLGDATTGPAQAVDKIYGSMPKFVTNAATFFFGSAEELTEKISEGSGNVAEGITDQIVLPIVQLLLQVIFFLILLGVCMFLVRRIAKASGMVRHIPLIGSVNALFGGILGLAQGGLLIVILIGILSLVVAVTGGAETWFTPQTVEKTYLFKYLYDNIPRAFLMLG